MLPLFAAALPLLAPRPARAAAVATPACGRGSSDRGACVSELAEETIPRFDLLQASRTHVGSKRLSSDPHCRPLCAEKAKPWTKKCSWSKCRSCSECASTQAATEQCQLWCHSDYNATWDTKCTWASCSACDECGPIEVEAQGLDVPAHWSVTYPGQWCRNRIDISAALTREERRHGGAEACGRVIVSVRYCSNTYMQRDHWSKRCKCVPRNQECVWEDGRSDVWTNFAVPSAVPTQAPTSYPTPGPTSYPTPVPGPTFWNATHRGWWCMNRRLVGDDYGPAPEDHAEDIGAIDCGVAILADPECEDYFMQRDIGSTACKCVPLGKRCIGWMEGQSTIWTNTAGQPPGKDGDAGATKPPRPKKKKPK